MDALLLLAPVSVLASNGDQWEPAWTDGVIMFGALGLLIWALKR